jgi:hypothetical protein
VDFDWGYGSPDGKLPSDHFSTRWTGTLQVPESVGGAVLAASADDGVRVWVDGRLIIDCWGSHSSALAESRILLSTGQKHSLRVEYQELGGTANVRLQWRPALSSDTDARELWIPPGNWINAWTGEAVTGPVNVTNQVPLEQAPLYLRCGTILPLAPEMQYTGEKPWSPLTLDLYPCAGETDQATIYEDDTVTTAYQRGEFRETFATLSADDTTKTVRVNIGAARGHFPGALKKRSWILRLHRPENWPAHWTPRSVMINGTDVSSDAGTIHRLGRDVAAMPMGDPLGAPDGDVFEVTLPAASVLKNQLVEISAQK